MASGQFQLYLQYTLVFSALELYVPIHFNWFGQIAAIACGIFRYIQLHLTNLFCRLENNSMRMGCLPRKPGVNTVCAGKKKLKLKMALYASAIAIQSKRYWMSWLMRVISIWNDWLWLQIWKLLRSTQRRSRRLNAASTQQSNRHSLWLLDSIAARTTRMWSTHEIDTAHMILWLNVWFIVGLSHKHPIIMTIYEY